MDIKSVLDEKWLESNLSTSWKVGKCLWKNNLPVIIHDVIILHGQFRPLSLISVKTFFDETLNIEKNSDLCKRR